MNLHEYQVKKLLTRYGLSIPSGYACSTVHEVEKAANKICTKGPWIVKCQIHSGGRSKAGGVKFFKRKEEILAFAKRWLGKRLVTHQTDYNGKLVTKILVEEAITIKEEYYFSATIDYNSCRIVFFASSAGGVRIEEMAKKSPNIITKVFVDILEGPMPYQGRELAFNLGLKGKLVQKFTFIFMNIAKMFIDYDLNLIEINPIVINEFENFVCLDGKLIADKNALFRQPNLYKMWDKSQENPREIQAAEWKLNYISLNNGNIGCIANGAGLAMSMLDIIKMYGGNLANFLDIGGRATEESVIEAFRIVVSEKHIKAIAINIFGGITRCDFIADAVIRAIKKTGINIPVIFRLVGNNAEIGIKNLVNSGLNVILANSLIDLAEKTIYATKK